MNRFKAFLRILSTNSRITIPKRLSGAASVIFSTCNTLVINVLEQYIYIKEQRPT